MKIMTAKSTVQQMAALAPMVILSIWFMSAEGAEGFISRHWLPGGMEDALGLISL
jgi:hypothetical protein